MDMKELSEKVAGAEKNDCIQHLSQLRHIQTNMSVCKKQFDSLSEWDQYVKNIETALTNNEIEVFCFFHSIHSVERCFNFEDNE